MGLGIGINWEHVALWRRWLITWLVFVGFAVVVGWRYGPRQDEVTVAVFLPLLVLVPYALGCLLLALARALFAGAGRRARRAIVHAVQIAHDGINRRAT